MRSLRIPVFLLFAAFLFACSSSRLSVQNKNVATIYNPGSTSLHPEFCVIHINDTISQVYFRIFTDELLFNKANETAQEKASVRIHYVLFNTRGNGKMNDSATISINLNRKNCGKEFTTFFTLRMNPGDLKTLEIITTDLLRNSSHLHFLIIDKSTVNSPQNFMLKTKGSPLPLFHRFLTSVDTVIVKNLRVPAKTYHIKFFRENYSSPLPPFSITPYHDPEFTPDSTWTIQAVNEEFRLVLLKRGMYHIMADTAKSEGVTLYNFGDFFPLVKTTSEMIKSARYITTSKEYKKLSQAANEKAAIDSFWLKPSGNISRAKELIRVYYSRVTFANIYFSSFIPGWLSDRGMIYIIFGPPKTIFKADDSERWIYGDNKNLMSMDFFFQNMKNAYSENYFVLKRGDIYKASWYQATDTWRNGRIYSVEN
ncbi:MAG: GWxTD domain-containing protein [Bacteroidia bacterium]|nr:GWxTD domain-containing protein [Bacteroidia bacterium]